MHLFECNTEDELKHCVKQHIHLVRFIISSARKITFISTVYGGEKSRISQFALQYHSIKRERS